MVNESDAASPKMKPALQAVVALDAYCPSATRVLLLDQGVQLAPLLKALGHTVLDLDDLDSSIGACVVSGRPSAPELERALGAVAENGFLVFGTGDIADGDLARLGFAGKPHGVGAIVAIKGDAPPSAVVDAQAPADAVVSSGELKSALGELDKRMSERLDRLALQNTQLVNSLERLSYALSLKGRLVGILRRTGTLGTVAALLGRLRKARGAIAQKRPATAGPVVQMPSGTAVWGPLLIASLDQEADEIEAASNQKGIGVTRLKPTVRRTGQTDSVLARPEADSLAGWLAQNEPQATSTIRTVMVDLDDREIAVNLLRGRLLPEQALLLVRPSDQSRLPAWLGAPDATRGRLAYYQAAPALLRADGKDDETPAGFDWPRISMVMVSFNQAAFLEEGINSILDQNYPNLEFILVDGGSTDGSADIIERYRNRIDKVVIERDRGQSDGLNKGFDRATGEILSWLNSDDLLLPGALAKVGKASRVYGAEMIVGGCIQVQQNGRDVVVSHHNHLPFGQTVPLPLDELLDFDNRWQAGAFFYQPEVFFSRELWLRSGGGLRLDLYYVLDYDLWIRMAAAGATVAHIPDFLAASRIHDQQKTTFGENPFIPETRRLLAEYSGGVHWTRPPGA